VLYFAGWKQHYSLYPAGEHVVATFKDQLSSYEVTKGTIRFPLSEPVPVKLIERIAKFRAKEKDRACLVASDRREVTCYEGVLTFAIPGLLRSKVAG
jgi:uncharacterized protein YdhG (YjbR/CyaY superfamily)